MRKTTDQWVYYLYYEKSLKKLLYDQLREHLQKYLYILLCGFQKAHSTQHVLFKLLQAWLEELEKSGFVGIILMDLSKTYDCLPNDLLAAIRLV